MEKAGLLPFVMPEKPTKGSFEHDLLKFLENVPDQPTDMGCYEWLGAPRDKNNGDFHGAFYAAKIDKSVRAHRWLYENFLSIYYPELFPPLLPGQVVRHACDNAKCVTPCHLIPGTHADNMADAVRNGRLTVIKVDAEMAAKMREARDQDEMSYGQIAKLVGVSKATAHRILTGQFHPERRLAA